MTAEHQVEIQANLERATSSIQAAEKLKNDGYYGVTIHVTEENAETAVHVATEFVQACQKLLEE